jgi:cysteine desulfurase
MPPIYLDTCKHTGGFGSRGGDEAIAGGGSSAIHRAGIGRARRRRLLLERARGQVAALISAAPEEDGVHQRNLAIKGTFFARNRQETHIVTSAIEIQLFLPPADFSSGSAVRRLGYLCPNGPDRQSFSKIALGKVLTKINACALP